MPYILEQMYDLPKRKFNLYKVFGKISRFRGEISLTKGIAFVMTEPYDNGVVKAYLDGDSYIIISEYDLLEKEL